MKLPLTAETMAGAYAYLQTTPPFKQWNLPLPKDIVFKVHRSRVEQGSHRFVRGRHVLKVSSNLIVTTRSLIEVMAHEMVHVYQLEQGLRTNHAGPFKALAARVCRIHGFDPGLF